MVTGSRLPTNCHSGHPCRTGEKSPESTTAGLEKVHVRIW